MVELERLKAALRILPVDDEHPDDSYLEALEAAAAEYVSALAEYTESDTPSEMAMKAVEFLVVHWYINRVPVTDASATTVPDTLAPMLQMVSKAVV